MQIKNLLIVDTETTGIDSENDTVIELGAILYSVEHQCVLTQFSTLYHAEENPCEHINRISASALKGISKHFEKSESSHSLLGDMADTADAYVAHNAEFDKGFLGWEDKQWLCTCFDFKWPQATKEGGSLINLALEHGIGVSSAHRALTDCQLISALFDRMDNLGEMIERAARPKAMFIANVSYDDRNLAKAAGFKWNPETKKWIRQMAIEDASALSFPVSQM